MIKSINPATEEEIYSYNEMPETEVNKVISGSYNAFLDWQKTDFQIRTKYMNNAAKVLRFR